MAEAQMARNHLARRLPTLAENPAFFSTFAGLARDAAGLDVAAAHPEAAVAWLRQSARVSALHFGRVAFPEVQAPMPIGDVEIGALASSPPWTEATPFAWIDATWCAMAVADVVALNWLTNIPESVLMRIAVSLPTRCDEYALGLAETLRAVVLRNGRHGDETMRTLEAMPPVETASRRLELVDEPALRALVPLFDRDSVGYTEALERLLASHRAFWGTGGPAVDAPRGLISLPACALERLARSLGLPQELESPYAPAAIWQAPQAT